MKTIFRNFLSVIRRFKMATLLNILGLSVAFSACILIGMQLNYDLNYGKCHADHESIYRVERIMKGERVPFFPPPFLEKLFNYSPHIIAGTYSFIPPWAKELSVSLTDENGVVQGFVEPANKVHPDFASFFNFQMYEGDIHAMRTPETVLIPVSISRKLFGNEPAVGKILKGVSSNYTVGGVYHDFPENTFVGNSVYYPVPREEMALWDPSMYEIFIKLDKQTDAEVFMNGFFDSLEEPLRSSYFFNTTDQFLLSSLRELHFQQETSYDTIPKVSYTTLLVLLGIAIVIIVIAVINFTNFSVALTPMRVKNINTQKVLGAKLQTLRNSMVLESVLISLVSFLIALYFVFVSRYTFISDLLDVTIRLDNHILLIISVGAGALLIGCIAGLYPAFYTTSFAPALVLKGSFGLSPKGRKLRNVLIGIQYIASFVLIITAVCMYCQNRFMQTASFGYNKENIIITEMNETLRSNRERLIHELTVQPEIMNVSFSDLPISASDNYYYFETDLRGEAVGYEGLPVDYTFPEFLNIEVTKGRNFLKEDERKPHGALLINETARKKYNLELGMYLSGAEIVGFIPDIKFASFRATVEPMGFRIFGTEFRMGEPDKYSYIKLKDGADLYKAKEQIRDIYRSLDPAYAYEPRFFESVLQQLYEKEERLSALITLFGLMAVFISLVGVFGLVVFESEYKRKEIGVRKVFGSTTKDIVWMFNRRYMHIVMICFLIASPVAYYVILKWLENFAYRAPVYWWVFLFSFILISLITMCTVTFQNWQAANTNPINSLKSE